MRSSRLNAHPVPHTLSVPAPFLGGLVGGGVSPTRSLTCTSTRADGVYVLRTVTGMCVACGKRGDVRLPPGVTAHLMDLMKTKGPNQRAVVHVCA